MRRLVIGSFVFLFIAACASSHVLTGTARPEIDPSQVKIYSHPPANFEEVALLTASSESSWAWTEQGKTNAVIEGLKKEAAKRRCEWRFTAILAYGRRRQRRRDQFRPKLWQRRLRLRYWYYVFCQRVT